MRYPTQKLAFLFPLVQTLSAQFVPESEARLVAWRAYGNFVGSLLTAGSPIVKGRDVVYVTPPNMAAVRGGTPVPESVTNNDLFYLADGLQNQSEPLLDIQGPSYIKALFDYLESVDLGTVKATDEQLAKIEQLQKLMDAAQEKFNDESDRAQARWYNDVRAQANKQTFKAWVNQRDPLYNSYQRQVEIANGNLQNYQIAVYGPQYRQLTAQRDKIEYRAGEESELEPGYNMPVYPNAYTVSIKPFMQHEQTEGILWKPLYSLQGGFEESCDAWINGTSSGTTRYSWSLKNVKGEDWSTLGHTSTVKKIGGSGYWGLISAQRTASAESTVFNSFTSNYNTSISLELTMEGSPLIFNIGAGYWDVAGVRNTYPTLLPKVGADNLKGKVRLQKLLIGHRIGLKITVADAGMWKSIYKFVEDAQKNTGGGFSIFGFHFGAGGTSASHRESNTVKMEAMQEGGIINIPPSPPGVTFLLGALGKVQ